MRYVYTVISSAEAAELSLQLPQSLMFTNYIDVDGYFIDVGSSRRERGALLRTVKPNDQVVIESRLTCGLTPDEVNDLEHRLWEKKARLICAIPSDSVPVAGSGVVCKALPGIEGRKDKEEGDGRKGRIILYGSVEPDPEIRTDW